MKPRQWLTLAGGLVFLAHNALYWPVDLPDALLPGIDHVWMGERPPDSGWRYLPRLHAAELVFIAVFTLLLIVVQGDHTSPKQKRAAWLAVGGFWVLCAVWFPWSLTGMVFGYPEEFVINADVVLAMTLAFMYIFRNEPAVRLTGAIASEHFPSPPER